MVLAGPNGPWLFPFVEEPGAWSSHRPCPYRPAAAVSIASVLGDDASPKFLALIDSGSERTLVGPGLGRLAEDVDLDTAPKMNIRIGGGTRTIRFGQVTMRLFQHVDSHDEPPLVEWVADVGFIQAWEPPWSILLGQQGFFEHFTVTMGRSAMTLAIESPEVFDERFPPQRP